MNVISRNSTRRMIDQSRASVEAEGFIAWLSTDGYRLCHRLPLVPSVKRKPASAFDSSQHRGGAPQVGC